MRSDTGEYQPPYEFIKSQQGRALLVVDGFTYSKERQINEKTHWKCTEYKKASCPARCHMLHDAICTTAGNLVHSHAPVFDKIQRSKAMEACRVSMQGVQANWEPETSPRFD